GIAARRLRLALGIGIALEVAGALALAVGLQIVPPAIAEIGPQLLDRALRMDVAIDDPDARSGAAFGLPDFHVHCDSSSYFRRVGKGAKAQCQPRTRSIRRRAHHSIGGAGARGHGTQVRAFAHTTNVTWPSTDHTLRADCPP